MNSNEEKKSMHINNSFNRSLNGNKQTVPPIDPSKFTISKTGQVIKVSTPTSHNQNNK